MTSPYYFYFIVVPREAVGVDAEEDVVEADEGEAPI
jgi:hypothetical protein